MIDFAEPIEEVGSAEAADAPALHVPPPAEIPLMLCYESDHARPIDMKAVKALAGSIAENGLMQPITVRRARRVRAGQMADAYEVIMGMHRVKACRQLGRETITAYVIDVDDLRAELMLIDENLYRNEFSPAERAAAVSRRKVIYEVIHPETKHGSGTGGHSGRSKLEVANLATSSDATEAADRFTKATADATGQSERSIRRDAARGRSLSGEALTKVVRTSLDKGDELDALAKLSPERRDELIARAAEGEKVSAKAEVKKERRATRESELAERQQALPEKRYGVILADPEWRFEPYSRETGMDRAADNHYPTSPLDEIKARPVAGIAAADCVLFLWATAPMLVQGLEVMAAWGFGYRSHTIWHKRRPGAQRGPGYWFTGEHELLLVGVRGTVPAPAPGEQWPSLLTEPVQEHSVKPEVFAQMIEEYFPNLPKIELNARRARPGWDVWGLEAPEAVDA